MTSPSGKSREILDLLKRHESRNVTFVDPEGGWPVVWKRAKGCHVWDVEGRRYLDLTAAFGVTAAGHANAVVVRAGRKQMGELLHAMGDVHPHPLKARLARELSGITFERWKKGSTGKVIFGSSGFEAVEAALKTARLATGKPGVIAFRGGYHGLGYGALNATERDHFRGPFRNQLREFGRFVAFPEAAEDLAGLEREVKAAFDSGNCGAIIVEPLQARGGIRIPPTGFLPLLRHMADANGALLILDEIYTGFGRTGRWFACEHSKTVPDLICVGKALTGGFPLSACIGRADLMDAAWPPSNGEAIHTSTFLGHPVGCAMALAQIGQIRAKRLLERAKELGAVMAAELAGIQARHPALVSRVAVAGLMGGIELMMPDGKPATALSLAAIKKMLALGYIMLPEGAHAEVIGFTPPLTIPERDLRRAIRMLGQVIDEAVTAETDMNKPKARRTRKAAR